MSQALRFNREWAKIKDMKALKLICLLLPFNAYAAAPLNCEAVDVQRLEKEVQRINQRYDDFFRDRREREERAERMRHGSDDRKKLLEAHEKEMEKARQAYQAKPKDHAREEALRLEWEAEQKEKAKRVELARLCEVQQRAKAEELLKKGRAIPDLKEFDLDE